jgi:transcription-repair coupling factor (superfamily II helicase)
MRLRPALRDFKVLGCEASASRVALHLREDTPLDPAKVMRVVAQRGSGWKLSPSMLLTRRFDPDEPGDSLDRVEEMLGDLYDLRRDDA